MGRGVMTHPNAEVVAYASWEENRQAICRYCDEDLTFDKVDYNWVADDSNTPEYCIVRIMENGPYDVPDDEKKHEPWDYDADDFSNDLEAVTEYMMELWPSLYPVERWIGNEVHIVLENGLVEVSVSEYMGLVALCIAPRSDFDYEDHLGLAKRWISQVSERFLRTFGEYAKLGTFSNGETVYEKKTGD